MSSSTSLASSTSVSSSMSFARRRRHALWYSIDLGVFLVVGRMLGERSMPSSTVRLIFGTHSHFQCAFFFLRLLGVLSICAWLDHVAWMSLICRIVSIYDLGLRARKDLPSRRGLIANNAANPFRERQTRVWSEQDR